MRNAIYDNGLYLICQDLAITPLYFVYQFLDSQQVGRRLWWCHVV